MKTVSESHTVSAGISCYRYHNYYNRFWPLSNVVDSGQDSSAKIDSVGDCVKSDDSTDENLIEKGKNTVRGKQLSVHR